MGKNAEQDRRSQGDACGECQNATVDSDLVGPGDPPREPGDDAAEERGSGHETGGCPEEGEERALGNELSADAPTGGSEGLSHREIGLVGGGPGQEEAGEIQAGNEEDECHRAQEHRQQDPGIRHHVLLEANHRYADVFIRLRMLVPQPGRHDVHLLLGTLDGRGRRQPGDREKEELRPAVEQDFVVAGGDPELGFAIGECESLGHDRNDLVGLPFQHQGPAHRVLVAPDALPEPVADHHGVLGPRRVVHGGVGPAHQGGDPEDIEDAPHGHGAHEALRGPVVGDPRQRVAAVPGECGKRPRPFAPVHQIAGTRHAQAVAPIHAPVADSHEGVGIRIGERLDQHSIHHRKDGRVRADPQGQRAHGNGQERRSLRERPARDAYVHKGVCDDAAASPISHVRLPGVPVSCAPTPRPSMSNGNAQRRACVPHGCSEAGGRRSAAP